MSGINELNDLPPYRADPNYANQEYYQELFNLLLSTWLSSSGFQIPNLTTLQIADLIALTVPPPAGTLVYNKTLDVLQFVGATGAIQTISSSY